MFKNYNEIVSGPTQEIIGVHSHHTQIVTTWFLGKCVQNGRDQV